VNTGVRGRQQAGFSALISAITRPGRSGKAANRGGLHFGPTDHQEQNNPGHECACYVSRDHVGRSLCARIMTSTRKGRVVGIAKIRANRPTEAALRAGRRHVYPAARPMYTAPCEASGSA